MKLQKLSRKCFVAAGAAAMLFALSPAQMYAGLDGRWVQHPSFCIRSETPFSQIDRIIDGEKYVYFSVRGFFFDRNNGNYYTSTPNSFGVKQIIDPIVLFRYDKSLPWNGDNILPVAREFELGGVLPSVINYSPEAGVFAVIYDNNVMDLIYDDGTQLTTPAIKEDNFKPYSITFDPERDCLYVAGSSGYSAVSLKTGELMEKRNFNLPLSWAGRVGDNMVVFGGTVAWDTYSTSTYIFPADNVPASLSAPIEGGTNLQALMPLTDNTFAAIGVNSTGLQHTLKLVTMTDGGATVENLAAAGTVDNGGANRYRHMFGTDGFTFPTREGFGVFNGSGMVLLKKGVEKSDDGFMTTFLKPENNIKAASIDGKNFWMFSYASAGQDASAKGFFHRDYADGAWGDKSVLAAPSAPTSMFAYYSKWHPELGLIIRGPGALYTVDPSGPDLLCSYKDGKWTDLTPAANYSTVKYGNVTTCAMNVAIDPVNPNWIWGGSPTKGLFRIDLNDYSNFFQIGSTNYSTYGTTYPGYFPLFPYQKPFRTLINFPTVDFDSDGTMWFTRYWFVDDDDIYREGSDKPVGEDDATVLDEIKYARVPIYYFTAEERLAMDHIKSPGDNAKATPHEMTKVFQANGHQRGQLLALKKPASKNYLAFTDMFTLDSYRRPFLYDHAGTLEDTSDDRVVFLQDMYDEEGEKYTYLEERFFYEDDFTGELWFCTSSGPLLIDPSAVLNGDKTGRRLKTSKREGVPYPDVPFEYTTINAICPDITGRKWIASNQGLFCLSADNEDVVAHYTTSNSRIPSNDVFGVSCNLETGAVYVLTDRGLAEFIPEDSDTAVPAGAHVAIWPSFVTPDFNGYVNFKGVETGSEYTVFDSEGNPVVSIGSSDNGLIQWDVKDNEGKRLPAGKYNVKRPDKDEENTIVIL